MGNVKHNSAPRFGSNSDAFLSGDSSGHTYAIIAVCAFIQSYATSTDSAVMVVGTRESPLDLLCGRRIDLDPRLNLSQTDRSSFGFSSLRFRGYSTKWI